MSDDVSKYVKQLEAERIRIGKEVFSTEERVKRLNRIYDSLLVLLEKLAVMGKGEKTANIIYQLQGTRLEAYELQRQYGSVTSGEDTPTVGWPVTEDDATLEAMFDSEKPKVDA